METKRQNEPFGQVGWMQNCKHAESKATYFSECVDPRTPWLLGKGTRVPANETYEHSYRITHGRPLLEIPVLMYYV